MSHAHRSPLRFFLWVFALSVPFAALGAIIPVQLAPGIPISALGFICPVTAASILSYREGDGAALRAQLARAFDFGRIRGKIWYLPVVLLMPVMTVAAWALMRELDLPLRRLHITPLATLLMGAAFFVAALGEELGWSGYALEPLQRRWQALPAALLLGVVWAAWHIVAMVQAGQSWGWIAWGCLDMVGTRVLMVWLYNTTQRSVFAVALYHAIANVATKSVFPGGSYEGERILSVIIALVASAVTAIWGWRTLRRPEVAASTG